MSTTEQLPPDAVRPSPTETPEPTPAPQPARAASNSREYVIFEEARTDTWSRIGTAEADSPQAAIESLGEQKLKTTQARFMAIPARFVQPKKPKVTTVTNIDWD